MAFWDDALDAASVAFPVVAVANGIGAVGQQAWGGLSGGESNGLVNDATGYDSNEGWLSGSPLGNVIGIDPPTGGGGNAAYLTQQQQKQIGRAFQNPSAQAPITGYVNNGPVPQPIYGESLRDIALGGVNAAPREAPQATAGMIQQRPVAGAPAPYAPTPTAPRTNPALTTPTGPVSAAGATRPTASTSATGVFGNVTRPAVAAPAAAPRTTMAAGAANTIGSTAGRVDPRFATTAQAASYAQTASARNAVAANTNPSANYAPADIAAAQMQQPANVQQGRMASSTFDAAQMRTPANIAAGQMTGAQTSAAQMAQPNDIAGANISTAHMQPGQQIAAQGLGQVSAGLGSVGAAQAAQDSARATQLQQTSRLTNAADGMAPSVAQHQLAAGLTQGMQNNLAMAASARGSASGSVLAQRQALDANTNLAARTNAQSAQLRAGEMAQARGELTQHLGQVRGQDLGAGALGAQAAGVGANVMGVGTQQMGIGAQLGTSQAGLQQQASLANQQMAFGTGQANLDASMQARLANQQSLNTAGQVNVNAGLQAAMANQQTQLSAGQSNLGAQQQTSLANQQANMTAAQANLGSLMQAQLANQNAGLVTGQANLAAQQQSSLANQQTQLAVSQANLSAQTQTQLANLNAELASRGMDDQQRAMYLGAALGIDARTQQGQMQLQQMLLDAKLRTDATNAGIGINATNAAVNQQNGLIGGAATFGAALI